jgi:hypothetical protein
MPADQFSDIIVPQILAGEFYCVSHAYAKVRTQERWDAVFAAFDHYAPRYDGDDEYDVQLALAKLRAARSKTD